MTKIIYNQIYFDGYDYYTSAGNNLATKSYVDSATSGAIDGYALFSDLSGLNQTVTEHNAQQSEINHAVVTALDGYGDVSGSGTTGEVTLFNGANSVNSSDMFTFDETYGLFVDHDTQINGTVLMGSKTAGGANIITEGTWLGLGVAATASTGFDGIEDVVAGHNLEVKGSLKVDGAILNSDLSAQLSAIGLACDGYSSSSVDLSAYETKVDHSADIYAITSVLDGYIDVGNSASIGDGYVAFFDGNNKLSGDNDLFWDRANNRLGIGKTNPTVSLDVAGIINGATITASGNIMSAASLYSYTYQHGLILGSSQDIKIASSQDPVALSVGLGAASKAMIVCEHVDYTYNFAHPLQTNPTMFIHSANQDTTEWLSFTHDQTDGYIATGKGAIKLSPFSGKVLFSDTANTKGLQLDAANTLITSITPTSDVATTTELFKGQNAYADAATNKTGGDIILAGGVGVKYATAVSNTAGAVTVDMAVNGGAKINFVSGIDFVLGADNTPAELAVTAGNFASAINANTSVNQYVVAVANAAVCTIYPRDNCFAIYSSSSSSGLISVNNSTNGAVKTYGLTLYENGYPSINTPLTTTWNGQLFSPNGYMTNNGNFLGWLGSATLNSNYGILSYTPWSGVGGVLFDGNNSIIKTNEHTSDTLVPELKIRSGASFTGAVTNIAGTRTGIYSGIPSQYFTVLSNGANSNQRIIANEVTYSMTAGTSFTKGTDDTPTELAVTATNMKNYINGLTGLKDVVTATSSGAIVYLAPKPICFNLIIGYIDGSYLVSNAAQWGRVHFNNSGALYSYAPTYSGVDLMPGRDTLSFYNSNTTTLKTLTAQSFSAGGYASSNTTEYGGYGLAQVNTTGTQGFYIKTGNSRSGAENLRIYAACNNYGEYNVVIGTQETDAADGYKSVLLATATDVDGTPAYKHIFNGDGTAWFLGNISVPDINLNGALLTDVLDGYASSPAAVNYSGDTADGYVAFFTGAGAIAGDNDLYWDRSNNKLVLTSALESSGVVITNGSSITTSSSNDLVLSANNTGNLIVSLGLNNSILTGPVSLRGSAGGMTSSGSVLFKTSHGIAGISVGDIVHITSCTTTADIGFYVVTDSSSDYVIIDEALSGTDSDVSIKVYGNVNSISGQWVLGNSELPVRTPIAVRNRLFCPPYNTATENAAVYIKLNHRPGETDLIYGLYGEIDAYQSQVGGCISKVLHRGRGDAHYVGIIGDGASGYGYEAAMFGGDQGGGSTPKQENGFLASFQGAGGFQESRKNQSNSICYHALVHDDASNPTIPDPWATSYGLFFANNSLGNSFVSRVSQYADNYPQFKLIDYTPNQRIRWAIYADGRQHMEGEEATAGIPQQSSPELYLGGKFYLTGAEYTSNTILKTVVSATNTAQLYTYLGTAGSEAVATILTPTQLSLQNHAIADVSTLTLYTGTGTGIDMQTKNVINAGSITLYSGSGTGLDLQTKNIVSVGSLSLTGPITLGGVDVAQVLDGYIASSDYSITASKTSAYSASFGEVVRCDPSSAGFTITLPDPSGGSGKTVVIKNTTSSANTITIDSVSAELIDGLSSVTISEGYKSLTLVSYGTEWGRI